MNKALEAFYKIKAGYICGQGAINEYALRENERESLDLVEATLKKAEAIDKCHLVAIPRMSNKTSIADECVFLQVVIKIIIKKDVEMGLLKSILHADKNLHTASYYNSHFVAEYRHLTQEEFDMITGVLMYE